MRRQLSMNTGMLWIVKKLETIYQEHGTTPLRRFLLAFLCGSAVGFLAYCEYERQEPGQTWDEEAVLMTFEFGVATAIVGALLPSANAVFQALWKGGIIRKFFAFILILIVGWFLLGAIACAYFW